MSADYYVLLGISRGADLKKIKSAYRKVAKQCHPDMTRSQDGARQFREIKEAYETLADENKRKSYDDELARQESPRPGPLIAEAMNRRVSAFHQAERFATAVDEFLEGFLPGFFESEHRRFPHKDLYYEIILSPREALEGGLFPVTIPVLEACPRCGNTGSRGSIFCAACSGYGRVRSERTVSLSIPPRTPHGTQARISLEDIGLKDAWLNILVTVDPGLEQEIG